MRSSVLLFGTAFVVGAPLPAAAEPSDEGDKKPTSTIAAPSTTGDDASNVDEVAGRSYVFVGARYRGNVIPRFLINAFVDEGATIFTNIVGLELDVRKDGFSLIPALSYQELGTADILFKEKGSADFAGNYSVVNSSMKIIYATVDLLWSTKVSKSVEIEYGAGFGVGAVIGDLGNSWVREDPNGPLEGSNGKHYTRCDSVLPPGVGCNRADHRSADRDKVGGYTEASWVDGGSKPTVFPWMAVPQLGVRFKPSKSFAGRVGLGFALTGFFFGMSVGYGLERRRD